MHRENVDARLGRATIEPGDPVEAGSRGTWRLEFTAGEGGIEEGGSLRVTIPHGFTPPQVEAFFEPGFTTVETGARGVELSLRVKSDIFCRLDPASGHSGAWGRSVFVRVGGRGLRAGESVILTYGNADYYGGEPFSRAGARVRELSGSAEFTVAVDPDGLRSAPYSGYSRIADPPTIQVLPGAPTTWRATIPSDLVAGWQYSARVVALDRFNNPAWTARNPVSLPTTPVGAPVVRGSVEVEGVVVATNPARVHPGTPGTRVLWGDLHGHTSLSDGLGTLDEYFTYARETASLDFTAVTDHDDIGPRLSDGEWLETCRAVDEFYEPGEFVTFLGHEYRNGRCDMNAYYPGGTGELLRGTDDGLGSAAEFTRRVAAQDGMVVPHMHFGADWSGFDPRVYRLLEIYSQHGSAEHRGCPREIPYLRKQLQKSSESNLNCFAHEALALGYRLGFTAGSDTHAARPGLSDWTRTSRTYLGGLTAVFATEATREAVWRALRERHCYATTGNRSLLEFAVNGAPMGSEVLTGAGDPREVRLACHADGELVGVTVFRSGEVWLRENAKGDSYSGTFEDAGRERGDWYYARFDLAGGEMAWSSPVWVDIGNKRPK
ncbi:MAG: CehA/McbA family metallohydrolase [Promethearchaeota archaeon]